MCRESLSRLGFLAGQAIHNKLYMHTHIVQILPSVLQLSSHLGALSSKSFSRPQGKLDLLHITLSSLETLRQFCGLAIRFILRTKVSTRLRSSTRVERDLYTAFLVDLKKSLRRFCCKDSSTISPNWVQFLAQHG